MTVQSPLPPREIARSCPEAQADGFPCEDTSSECGTCPHGVAAREPGARELPRGRRQPKRREPD